MEQLLVKSASQLFLRHGRTAIKPLTALRYLTQADLPNTTLGQREAASQPDASHNDPTDPASPFKVPSLTETSDARMTSAGILLPKDSASDLDKKPAKEGDSKGANGTSDKGTTRKGDKKQVLRTMQAWCIPRFGDISSLQLMEDALVPTLSDPSDILVQIHAASVNPFDVAMTRGYGENMIGKMRSLSKCFPVPFVPKFTDLFTRKEDPFPLTLGRDFSGVVVDAGKSVKDIKAGDEVFGVIGPHRQGAFAEYAATSNWCVAKKPKNITHVQAASFPYVACTSWTLLKLVENLPNRSESTRVLVLGASGGVGSFAVQYLKTLGVHVTSVCGTDGLDLLAGLGADDIIDYKTANIESELDQREKYDVIFQAAGSNYDHLKKYLKGNLKSFFVTLNYPLLKNIDDYGSFAGLLKSGVNFSSDYFKGISKGNHTIWAFFTPNGPFLVEVARLIDQEKVRPVVGKTFPFKDLPAAFREVDSGNTNGKVVVQVK